MKHNYYKNRFNYATIFLYVLLLLFPNSLNAKMEKRFQPSWIVGQTWQVEVEKKQEPKAVPSERQYSPNATNKFLYRFVVERIESIEGENFYKIRIDCIGVDGNKTYDRNFYNIYFRKNDLALIKIQRRSKLDNRIEAEKIFISGPVYATDWVGFLPMDFPVVNEDTDETTGNNLEKTNKNKNADIQKMSVKVESRDDYVFETLKIEFSKKGNKNKIERRNLQKWIPGLPWWAAALHERDGKEFLFGKLVKVNNTKVKVRLSKTDLLK